MYSNKKDKEDERIVVLVCCKVFSHFEFCHHQGGRFRYKRCINAIINIIGSYLELNIPTKSKAQSYRNFIAFNLIFGSYRQHCNFEVTTSKLKLAGAKLKLPS